MSTAGALRLTLAAALLLQVGTLVGGTDSHPVLITVGSNAPLLVAVAIVVHRASTHPDQRRWLIPVGAGIFFFGLGVNAYIVVPVDEPGGVGPVLTQVSYIVVYPLLLSGILLALGRHLRHARLVVGLDGLTGAVAGAAVTAYAIAPLIARVWDGSSGAVFGLALVCGDLLLIAASLGALATTGAKEGRTFAVWALGMLVFTIGDIVYAYLLAYDRYVFGTLLDASWTLGLGLIAVGATTQSRPQTGSVPPARSLAVVTLSSIAAVTVLAVSPDVGTDPLPSALAIGTLAVAGVRLALAFLQLRELAVVRQQALTDELTGVGNRRALYRRLDDLLGEPGDAVAELRGFSLALVDLDHFKEVNDSFGHGTGDELLQTVACRFADTLGQLGVPHLLTRLGADEFAVVLDGIATPDAALGCGIALQDSLHPPFVLPKVKLHVRASIGIAMAPEHARSRSDMLFAADAAMYAGKSSGEPVSLFSPAVAGDRRNRLEVAEDLYAALERDELFVQYQPVVSTSGGVVGAEALVRWNHPTRGVLAPDEFLPVAERYRLTPDIARRVLDLALSDLRRWHGERDDLHVSVNVSASDLQNERLVDLVAAALLEHGVPPSALTIEVTETALMRDPEVAQTTMQALDGLGVRLSVDDYGTGYSSLEYLLKLPINEIKLDRTFSTDLANAQRSVAIVRSTIDLTHALGLHMVAEGVEDAETLAILRDLGCDLVQGWHLGRPTSAADFMRLVKSSPARLDS